MAGNSFSHDFGNAGYGAHPVASKLPNAYGLFDMIGNLSEWCHESWSDGYKPGSIEDSYGSFVTNDNSWHAIRGGNWGNDPIFQRAANRTLSTPAYQFYFVGFRLVRRSN